MRCNNSILYIRIEICITHNCSLLAIIQWNFMEYIYHI